MASKQGKVRPTRKRPSTAKPKKSASGFGVDPNRAVLPIEGYKPPRRRGTRGG